ncbi:diguanylate cyclase [Pseudomonas monteilii]|uniref:Diguanylate cyclase n=1 Tax=Pseudomonas monteilii TaxID=76759 RepID=A0A399M516_9PSED|nr:diguanylate cyclase [Pseudomonas monteilii]
MGRALPGPVGAGLPANEAPRCMAPASPVFAGKPAPAGFPQN